MKAITFGELMLRLAPEGYYRFVQADKLGARLILIVGGDELAAGKVKVRDMVSHDEELVDRSAIVEAVRRLLS